ncbi:MAG TPA: asparagine synthetase A [Candidatus Bathyarchaeia archaeon]|nr:asparagine synthetase A [Candidatus Bathyarchaeia archaeon]
MRETKTILDPSQMIHGIDSDRKRTILKVQTKALNAMITDLVRKGFDWILPVTLAKSTDPLWPDPGASIEKRIEIDIYDETVRTMQSMIVHKLVLSSLGPAKFFIISPNIRIETRKRATSGWHLYEFTQLETEISGAKMEDVFRLYEDLVKSAIEAVEDEVSKLRKTRLRIPTTPFRVHSRKDLEQKYGKDWEQLAPEKESDPFWLTDIPREFYDFQDEATGAWRNYDLFMPEGYGEVLSGAEREFEYSKIVKKIERDGVKKDDYTFLLNLAKDGKLKPCAGAGLGIERFVAYLCGVSHVADVQPFPRIPGLVPPL